MTMTMVVLMKSFYKDKQVLVSVYEFHVPPKPRSWGKLYHILTKTLLRHIFYQALPYSN